MAGLQNRLRHAAPQPRTPHAMVRPRIGLGPRQASPRRRVADDAPFPWRSMALSVSVVILGGGMFLGVHLMGLETQAGANAVASRGAPSGLAVQTTAIRKPAPAAQAAAATARPTQPVSKAEAPAAPNAVTLTQAVAPTTVISAKAPLAAARPTAADFARPAFLEPMDAKAGAAEGSASPAPPASVVADGVDMTEVASIGGAAGAVMPLPEPKPDAMPAASAEGKMTRISMDVTFRSGPRRGRNVIGQLSAGTKVTLIGCKSWCEVVADGKRGYVYRRAVAR